MTRTIDPTPLSWPDEVELLPLLPLVHAAWVDGVLSPAEVLALRGRVEDQGRMTPGQRAALAPWLDPRSPPTPSELASLATLARRYDVGDVSVATRSLTDLGRALARAAGAEDRWTNPAAGARLDAIEAMLGEVGTDAARRLLGHGRAPDPAQAHTPMCDASSLGRFLDQDHPEVRQALLEHLGTEPLRVPLGIPMAEHRARTLDAVRFLALQGYGAVGMPEAYGGQGDPAGGVAVFETLAFGDLSVLVKYGVQFGLFGGSILQLGTRRHHERWLPDIASMALPGCYAMTETGHGSNVRDLRTSATYDAGTDELVLHTPDEAAGKDWIGNAALDGRMATVFARLIVAGEDHGVHAIVVPLRDEEGHLLQGVRIEDRGLKEGLNGVDNGRIWFDSVRVPRDNLLDRFAQIDDDGVYRSEIAGSGRRFFTMLGTLVTGRVSIAAASVSATKTGLTIAVRHTERRRQFGSEGEPEVALLDHRAVQRALMPRLAATYGLHFAVRDLQRRMGGDAVKEADSELEVRAAGLKAYASRHCVETLQVCREACGGVGYLAANRFGALKADTDVFTTFEGANDVLLQLVAKGLLSRFRHEMGDLRLWGMMRYIADRAGESMSALNPVVTRRSDEEHLLDPAFHLGSLEYREERLLRSVAQRLKYRMDAGMDSFRAINECQDHLLELANAHVERVVLEALQDGVARAPTPGLSEVLSSLAALYALWRIETHRGWYLEAGYLEGNKSRAIRARVGDLATEIRESARLLVDAWGIPDGVLSAPAAGVP